MSLKGLNRYRRIAGTSALLGILFYTALIPLHTVSEATTALLGAELADALTIISQRFETAASDHALVRLSTVWPASAWQNHSLDLPKVMPRFRSPSQFRMTVGISG